MGCEVNSIPTSLSLADHLMASGPVAPRNQDVQIVPHLYLTFIVTIKQKNYQVFNINHLKVLSNFIQTRKLYFVNQCQLNLSFNI